MKSRFLRTAEQKPHKQGTPVSRLLLYGCFAVLYLLALWRLDFLLLVAGGLAFGFTRNSPFGERIDYASPATPRSTLDPRVRGYLVIGGVMLAAGGWAFAPYAWPFAVGILYAVPSPAKWAEVWLGWHRIPGAHAMALGLVLIALALDLLKGGLLRKDAQTAGAPAGARNPQSASRTTSQTNSRATSDPIRASRAAVRASHAKPHLLMHLGLWLLLAATAQWLDWPHLPQFIVTMVGMGLLWYHAAHWPLFAAAGSFALAVYGWAAADHANGTTSQGFEHVSFLILLMAVPAGITAILAVLGRTATGLMDALRGTHTTAPWLQQLALGGVVCVLAFTARDYLEARTVRQEAAEQAARQAAIDRATQLAAAERAAKEERQREERARADALVPGITCRFETESRLRFVNQFPNPEPGVAGKRQFNDFYLPAESKNTPGYVQVMTDPAELAELRGQALGDPLLRLPDGNAVHQSPTGDRFLMVSPSGRMLHLASFGEYFLKFPGVACVAASGKRFAVSKGSSVLVFDLPVPDALPVMHHNSNLDQEWFR